MKKGFAIAAAAFILLALAGCAKKSGGVTFTIALNGDIEAVDPGRAWDFTTNQVTNQITEGLVTFDTQNNVVPLLAKSWAQTDPLTYIYEVRDDIVFSDGSKMTMDDVLFSFERARDPDGGTWFADYYTDVDHFEVSDWTFTIKLSQPNAIFQFVPATGAGRIISKAFANKVGADNIGTPANGVVGTGPFAYKKWTNGQEIVLVKNTKYWDKAARDANIIDTLVYKVIPDDTARVIALQNGQVDFCVNIPEDSIDQLSSSKTVTFTVAGAYRMQTLAFNTARAPMSDKNVRKAVSHALDLQLFQRTILKNAGEAGSVLPFGPALYGENASRWTEYLETAPKYDYNLDLAKSLMAQSAYPRGFNATLVINEASLAGARALFVQDALIPLGITVEIVKLQDDVHTTYQTGGALDANGARDYDMLLGGWEADYPDADGILEWLYTESNIADGYNSAAYSNARVESLITAQLRTASAAERFAIQKTLVDTIADDVPYIPFDYTTRQSALNNKWTGLSITSAWLWVLPMQNVRRSQL